MVEGVIVLAGHSGCPLAEPLLGDLHSVVETLVLPHHAEIKVVLVQLLEVLISSLGVQVVLLEVGLGLMEPVCVVGGHGQAV